MTETPTDNSTPAETGSLICGRSVDALLDQVAKGRAGDRDAHQQSCPHCQAALAEYDRLWAPLRALAAEQITAPEGFIDNALARIRGTLEDPGYGTLPTQAGGGVTRIAARVVVVTARHSAQAVPGVRVALSEHLTPRPGPVPEAGSAAAEDDPDMGGVSAGVAGVSTAIVITLAADYGLDLRALANRVRDTVTGRVRALTQLEPVEVTIIIDDVLP